ncbi:MAG: L-aspartate oxidase [Acidocella sp. 20-57-95]|nr:MAG: L-aspartate oxidase [Acidocella sp. 20-57-95]OYV62280.1 MAG: L-aspartate oxidase [Acidocella sp. 21-58-7]HQT63346.1 L-aspartate oxidase [Acidocella sp.]HQU03937.1 L-aspartate oxidase [Acidocella sp.]
MNNRPVIIGGGAAGLTAALCLAPRPVVLLCGGSLGGNAASGWAQGGIAAVVGPDDDFRLHVADTIAAGAGLCDPATVARIVESGPWVIETLLKYGADFGRNADGTLALGLEAAHSRRRIVHAKDATGAEVMRVLVKAVRNTPSITVLEHAVAEHIFTKDNQVHGVQFRDANGAQVLATANVIIASGGVGGLFAHTTNPPTATGAGLALAARAGANLRDLEFMQFHPTALACGLDPMPLISEAVRGEGAVFVDNAGQPFMQGGDLAARDIVARAVAAKYAEGDAVFLDARDVPAEKFPSIFAVCRANGIDPTTQPIPVRPAAHYHMGGIAVDAQSESSVHGLFACGEAAATGLHGANRLASNSLLEAMVTGRDAAAAINAREVQLRADIPKLTSLPQIVKFLPEIRKICSQNLGILRSAEALRQAIHALLPLAAQSDAALIAALMAQAALQREESRGGQFRTDYPATNPALAQSFITHIGVLPEMKRAA